MTTSDNDTRKVYTVEDWLFGCVNFSVPQSIVTNLLKVRSVERDTAYDDTDIKTRLLLKADLLKWIILGASKVNNTSDSDNGWSHSDGGYTLSKDDKKMLKDEANAIYDEYEPESVFGRKRTTVHSLGIMPAFRDFDGEPLPRRAQ
jgi:hypothetical protein